MKKFMMTAAAAMALTAPAWAQSDTDAAGADVVTFEQVQAANPDITAEQFGVLDANGDGVLDADEILAAQQSGLLATGQGTGGEAPAEGAMDDGAAPEAGMMDDGAAADGGMAE